MKTVYLLVVLVPLAGAAIAGLFGRQIGRVGAHSVTIAGVAIAWMGSMATLAHLLAGGGQTFNETIYTWMVIDGIRMEIGFLVDRLTAMMMAVVTITDIDSTMKRTAAVQKKEMRHPPPKKRTEKEALAALPFFVFSADI